MYHGDAAGETDINIFQGYQTLDGKEATGYMRYLDGNGYVSRTQRQERFIKNFYEDRQDCFGVTNAFFMYRAWHNVDSNISVKDMAQLAFDFRGVTADNIDFYILPGEMAQAARTATINITGPTTRSKSKKSSVGRTTPSRQLPSPMIPNLTFV